MQNTTKNTIVSIIIPCFNYGHYLAQALESVRAQSYKYIETIVVDDGSTDNTKDVAKSFSDVNYIYQKNRGLSAARNLGIKNSNGEFLVFLDADDWLLSNALVINVSYFLDNKEAGLVAGSYIDHLEEENKEIIKIPKANVCTYESLLRRNHIAMHASVMYPRWIFNHYHFDTSLKSCEDWDMYLKIARNYKIIQHMNPIAVYRRYGNSMSANYGRMLNSGLEVLDRQNKLVLSTTEQQNLKHGVNRIKKLYTQKMYNQFLILKYKQDTQQVYKFLWRYNKKLFLKFLIKHYCRS